MGTLTVIIGLLNTRTGVLPEILLLNFILGIITYFLLAGSGNVVNDIYDLSIDIVNKPQRPLPSERLSIKQAWIVYFVTFIGGVAVSIIHSLIFSLGFINVFLATFFGFVAYIYAKWGKKSGFPGNIIISISISIGLIYGAILNTLILNTLIPVYIYYFFFTAFFLLLSREIIKGCEDIEGDKQEGVKTIAIKLGIKKATYVSFSASVLAIIFFILPIFSNIINPILFLISMILGLIIVILAAGYMLKANLTKKDFKKISLLLKVGAFLGLITFLLSSV